MPIILEPVSTQNFLIYKAVRLRALEDAPLAFSSTYAQESVMDDAAWLQRCTDCSDGHCIRYLAMDARTPCGLVGCFLDDHDRTLAFAVSMWVAPERRRAGVGGLLIDAIKTWAAAQGACELHLMVTSSNAAAIKFYLRSGFSKTAKTAPYPNDPTLLEFEMLLPLA